MLKSLKTTAKKYNLIIIFDILGLYLLNAEADGFGKFAILIWYFIVFMNFIYIFILIYIHRKETDGTYDIAELFKLSANLYLLSAGFYLLFFAFLKFLKILTLDLMSIDDFLIASLTFPSFKFLFSLPISLIIIFFLSKKQKTSR